MNTPFKLKYKNSAFPFKSSPARQDKKDPPSTPTDTAWTEVPNSRTTVVAGTKEDEKNMRKNMSGGANAGKSSKDRMLDAFNDEFPE